MNNTRLKVIARDDGQSIAFRVDHHKVLLKESTSGCQLAVQLRLSVWDDMVMLAMVPTLNMSTSSIFSPSLAPISSIQESRLAWLWLTRITRKFLLGLSFVKM